MNNYFISTHTIYMTTDPSFVLGLRTSLVASEWSPTCSLCIICLGSLNLSGGNPLYGAHLV